MPVSLLFSGHMIDAPGRKTPRFPAVLEEAVRNRIFRTIQPYTASGPAKTDVMGFASAAQGGDIIFHELCRTHGIATAITIPFSPETFVSRSVAGTADDARWKKRFWKLLNDTPVDRLDVMMLEETRDAYQACNSQMLTHARAYGKVHLIAFWDGKSSDGPGGTADLVELASDIADQDIFSPAELSGGRHGAA